MEIEKTRITKYGCGIMHRPTGLHSILISMTNRTSGRNYGTVLRPSVVCDVRPM